MFVRGCFRVEELICSSVDGSLKEPSLDMPAAIHTQTCLELLTHTPVEGGREQSLSVAAETEAGDGLVVVLQ